jgi:membrane protease YdiL (CAAX protease family)
LPMPTSDLAALEKMFGSQSVWKLFTVGALSPGIFEELLFRGVCLGLLLRLGDRRRAVLFSSLYFALIHLSVFRLLPTFLLGALMAMLVLRSRSIFVAMFFHVVYNGGLLLGGYYAESHELPLDPQGVLAWVLSITALLAGAALLKAIVAEHDDALG